MAQKKTSVSRRDFLRVTAAAASAAAAGPLLAACQSATAVPTPTATATATALPPTITPAPASGNMPELVKFYPAVPSRVVRTHHAGAWTDPAAEDKALVPEVLRKMLDASITKLT